MKLNFQHLIGSTYWLSIPLIFLIGSKLVKADSIISTDKLLNMFQSTTFDRTRDPTSTLGRETRSSMQMFLRTRLSRIGSLAGGSDKGHEYLERGYETQVYIRQDRPNTIQGTNYILVLQGSNNESYDSPLAIVANYDTDMNEPNPTDDNGSGVVALVALAEHLVQQMVAKKIHLNRTVIFVATDTALTKYEYGVPTGAKSGAGVIANDWLPGYLKEREFAGAIVLDSIMNFDDSSRSQVNGQDFVKSFPSAYQKMSGSDFKGNFLALVQRDDDLDNPLAQAFEQGWRNSGDQLKSSQVKPELINFKFNNQTVNSEAQLHFLKSDQTVFWDHTGTGKVFPAILLTDTGRYRRSDCNPCSSLNIVATPNNLAFLQRNVMAVYSTILELQREGMTETGRLDTDPSDTNSLLLFIIFGIITFLVVSFLIGCVIYCLKQKKTGFQQVTKKY